MVPGKNGVTHAEIKCYACNTYGHFADQCPSKDQNNTSEVSHIFSQNDEKIKSTRIFIDSCSTHSVMSNRNLVRNIVRCLPEEVLTMDTNGGEKSFYFKADLILLPVKMYLQKHLLAKILSLKDVANIPGCNNGY